MTGARFFIGIRFYLYTFSGVIIIERFRISLKKDIVGEKHRAAAATCGCAMFYGEACRTNSEVALLRQGRARCSFLYSSLRSGKNDGGR
jgi:hypothetical protein